MTLEWFVLLFTLAVYALCSGSETGLFALNPLKIRHAARNSTAAALLLRLTRSPAVFLSTITVAINLANDAMVQAAIEILQSYSVADAALWATLILTPLLFVLGDVLPKQWMAVHAETTMPALAWPLAALRLLMLPLALPLLLVARIFEGRRDEAGVLGRQQWAALLREGERSAPGDARVMGAALRALEARGRGLAPFLRSGVPSLPQHAGRELVLETLAAHGGGFLLLERPEGPPALLTGTRLLQSAGAQEPAALATPLLTLPAHCDLAGALAIMRAAGVALAWTPAPAGAPKTGGGLLDLEYALSLLTAPPAPASRPARPA